MLIHIDGRLVDESRAVVSAFDRGFLFGDAIFESMRAYGGRVFRLAQHLDRLAESAELIGLENMPPRESLTAAIGDLLDANRLKDARLRLTVSRGRGRPGDYLLVEGPPTVVLSASPFSGLEPSLFESGVAIAISARRAAPAEAIDPAVKSTSRIVSVLARREARAQGAFEALLVDVEGRLTEGTASNLFLVSEGRLLTPGGPGTVLPGVTRGAVIEVAAEAGLNVVEAPIEMPCLRDADELFLTNTSWEVLPVVSVDGRLVGEGRPGPLSRDLLARYRALVARECARA